MEKVAVLNASCKLSLADPIILVSHTSSFLWLFGACMLPHYQGCHGVCFVPICCYGVCFESNNATYHIWI